MSYLLGVGVATFQCDQDKDAVVAVIDGNLLPGCPRSVRGGIACPGSGRAGWRITAGRRGPGGRAPPGASVRIEAGPGGDPALDPESSPTCAQRQAEAMRPRGAITARRSSIPLPSGSAENPGRTSYRTAPFGQSSPPIRAPRRGVELRPSHLRTPHLSEFAADDCGDPTGSIAASCQPAQGFLIGHR
jgi:hypothetical protein